MKTKIQFPQLTKDQIAQSAISELKANGARVRKVTALPYRKRSYQVERGWADVQGYSRSGVAILCEVKTKSDRFSDEQIERLEDLDQCGGIALVAVQQGFGVKLIPWKEWKIL